MSEARRYGGTELFLDIWPTLNCQCNLTPQCCVCTVLEKVLRAYSQEDNKLPPLKPEQRAWCVAEADSAGEGDYKPEDLVKLSDRELAYTVLTAWKDYVNDHF